MSLLSVNNLDFSWGYKPLIHNLSFKLKRGQLLGIAGPNGSGKSSLLSLLLGKVSPESGEIAWASGVSVAFVAQEPDFGACLSVGDYLLSEIRALEQRLRVLEQVLADDPASDDLAAALQALGALQEEYARLDGWNADQHLVRLLEKTGLPIQGDQDLARLSGGERSVLSLLKALMAKPDVLILDEPGNHLDYRGQAWLEGFLASLEQGIILVSHDRWLLDRVAGTILYLEAGRHWLHQGNYTAFRARRAEELDKERKAWAARERELAELGIELKDLQHQASQSCNPPPRVMIALGEVKKKIARLREIHDQGLTPRAPGIKLRLGGAAPKGDLALELRDLSLDYGHGPLLDRISFRLERGDRAALVGLNGCGKSSLIRLIRELASPDDFPVRMPASLRVGFLAQRSPFTMTERRLVDELQDWGPLSVDAAFALVAPYGFAWAELEKPIGGFSGGEIQRLQLARLAYQKVNFLILDEPSNHLDIESREVLESCLAGFEGTMLIVSHDRWLLDSFATRILHLEAGRIREYAGSYGEFLSTEAHGAVAPAPRRVPAKDAPKPVGPAKAPSAPRAGEARILALEAEIDSLEQAIVRAWDDDPGLAARLEAGLAKKQLDLELLWQALA